MSIKTGLSVGTLAIGTSDTPILNVSGREVVTAMNCHNESSVPVEITFYVSPDFTSANGKEIAVIGLNPADDVSVSAIVGQGYDLADNIVAVADAVGVNVSTTYTRYTGEDI